MVAFKVGTHGSTYGWEEFIFTEHSKKTKSLEFVFDWIFEFGEAKLDSHTKQRLV